MLLNGFNGGDQEPVGVAASSEAAPSDSVSSDAAPSSGKAHATQAPLSLGTGLGVGRHDRRDRVHGCVRTEGARLALTALHLAS